MLYIVVLTIGSSNFTVNGITHTLEVPAQIIGGSTMLPLRAVVESVGMSIDWDGATRTVLIDSGETEPLTPREIAFMELSEAIYGNIRQVLGIGFDFTGEVNIFGGGLTIPLIADGTIDRDIFEASGWGGMEDGEFYLGLWWGDRRPEYGTASLNLGIGGGDSLGVRLRLNAAEVFQLAYEVAVIDFSEIIRQVLGVDFDFTGQVNFFDGGLSIPLVAHEAVNPATFINPEWGHGWPISEDGVLFLAVWWGDGHLDHATVSLSLGTGGGDNLPTVIIHQLHPGGVFQLANEMHRRSLVGLSEAIRQLGIDFNFTGEVNFFANALTIPLIANREIDHAVFTNPIEWGWMGQLAEDGIFLVVLFWGDGTPEYGHVTLSLGIGEERSLTVGLSVNASEVIRLAHEMDSDLPHFEATFLGRQDLTQWTWDYSHREFFRLEDAYEFFSEHPTIGVLPYINYPVPVELGQVFVIRMTQLGGAVRYSFYRSSGEIWNEMESTSQMRVIRVPTWTVTADESQ